MNLTSDFDPAFDPLISIISSTNDFDCLQHFILSYRSTSHNLPFPSVNPTRKKMTSIKPLFGSVFLKSDFIALLTIAANEGFISVDFALSMTESISVSPLKNRISLRGDLTSLSGLRDTESRLRDISTPASTGRYKGTNRELERALDRMENGNEL